MFTAGRTATIILALAGVAGLAACADGPGPNELATPAEAIVVADDLAFEPETLTIEAGSEVLFRNDDDVDHIVAHGRPGEEGYRSSSLHGDGGRKATVYPSAGEFTYHCSIHPEMTGTIEVLD